MRVLQITSGYHKQTLYSTLFSRLQSLDVDSIVYSQINKGETVPEDIKGEKDLYFSKSFSKIERYSYFIKQNIMMSHIRSLFDMGTINLVHAHTLFSSGYLAYRLKKSYGIPYVVSVRSVDVNVFFKRYILLRPLGVSILKEASFIIFLSDGFKRSTLEKYISNKWRMYIEKKSVVVPNGIAPIFFEKKGSVKKLDDDRHIRLILVANINKNKNLEAIVKACRLLIKERYCIVLSIVGKIRDKRYYRYIKDNSDLIEYHEKCPQDQVIDYMRESDIFIMTSHYETFGLVYAEAMSQGLPIIYTKGQGFDGQFAEGEVGYHACAKNEVEIVDAVKKIICHYSELSANCIKGTSLFNWDTIVKQYINIYELCAL